MIWTCRYGTYEAKTPLLTYVVTKQYRRGEQMWFAFMRRHDDDLLKEVPGPLPLNRREAKRNCEEHAKEYRDG